MEMSASTIATWLHVEAFHQSLGDSIAKLQVRLASAYEFSKDFNQGVAKSLAKPRSSETVDKGIKEALGPLGRFRNSVRNWDLEEIVLDVNRLTELLILDDEMPELTTALDLQDAFDSLREFLDTYKAFRHEYEMPETFRLLLATQRAHRSVGELSARLQGLREVLNPLSGLQEAEEGLTLGLPVQPSVASAADTLGALGRLYARTSELVGADPEEEPLLLARAEHGSLRIVTVGKRIAVTILKALMKEFLGVSVSREPAREFTERAGAAIRMGEYGDLLEARGEDRTEIDAALRAASPYLIADFAKLFAGRGEVTIDGVEYDSPPEIGLLLPGGVRALLAAPRSYRRLRTSKVWHSCPNCSRWPKKDFEELPELPRGEKLDRECQAKERHRNCGPGEPI